MVVNSFNPLDQSSEVMTLIEMQERESVCLPAVSSRSCVQSLNVYHPEDKAGRFQPLDQSPLVASFSDLIPVSFLIPFPFDWGCGD